MKRTNINVHPNMARLARKIEKEFPYGEVTIIVQDGIPQRIVRAVVKEDLRIQHEKNKVNN